MANIRGKIASLSASCLTGKKKNTVTDIIDAMGDGTVLVIDRGGNKITLLYTSGSGEIFSIGQQMTGFDTQNFRQTFDGILIDKININNLEVSKITDYKGSFYVCK